MKQPDVQEDGALTKCQARHVSRHQHCPRLSPRRDAGLSSPKASSPDTAGSSCAWGSQAGREEKPFSEPCLQLTPGGSACGEATRHRVQRLPSLQAGGGSQMPGMELLWIQPKGSRQQAATHRAHVHRWQCQGDGDRHTAGLAPFTAPTQLPFPTVCERQVCHWDGALQEGSLAAGP